MGHSLTSISLVGRRRICLHRKPPTTNTQRSAYLKSVTNILYNDPSPKGVWSMWPQNRKLGKWSVWIHTATKAHRQNQPSGLETLAARGSRAGLMIWGGSQGNPHTSPQIPSSLCFPRSGSTHSAGISFVKLRVKRNQFLNSHLYTQFQRWRNVH